MSLDLASYLQEKGLSNRTVGQLVHDAWKKREPKRHDLPQPSSIAVKFGDLQRGKSTWWNNHPQALATLADLLGCAPEELVVPAREVASEIAFAEFDELPPLGRNEEPCALDEYGWLGTRASYAFQQGVHVWFRAPHGAGKTLTIEYLKQRSSGTVAAFTARKLLEVTRNAEPAMPLVVEVELADPTTDPGALRELTSRRTNTCILSPFTRPSLGAQQEDRWTDHEFEVQRGWRERLIRWTQGRLPESGKLDVAGLLDWLEDIDPQLELFATPGELLPVVAWCHRNGRAPSQKEKLDALADDFLGRLLDVAGQRHPFLRRQGRGLVDTLVKQRLLTLGVPNAALPRDTWLALLPTDAAPTTPADEIRRQVEAVARGRTAQARKKRADEAITALTAGRATETVDCLIDHGVLYTQANGSLDIHPVWVRRGLERRALTNELRAGDATRWGLLAADRSRQLAVDQLLDELSPPVLIELAAKALAVPRIDLGTTAAIEALFSAFARRMIEGWKPPSVHVPILQAIGAQQAALLRRAVDVEATIPPLPLTRMEVYSSWHDLYTFEAWIFSLHVPRPFSVAPRLRWLLPGWADDLRLASAPQHLYYRSRDFVRHLPRHAQNPADLGWIAREVLRRCNDEEAPEQVPDVLLPWLVIDGLPCGAKARPEHFTKITQWGAGETLADIVRGEGAELHERLVIELWPYVKAHANGHPVWALLQQQSRAPRFFQTIAHHLPREMFEQDLAEAKLDMNEVEHLGSLPDDLRRMVLHAIARRIGTTPGAVPMQTEKFIDSLGLDDVNLLVQFTSDLYSVGSAAARRVFELDPVRALAEARAALEHDLKSAGIWFYAAPPKHWSVLLDMLESYGVERVSWAPRWLARKLAHAGSEAPRVFRLLDAATPLGTPRPPS
ncbi:hypothetical protein [Polyangium sp. 6x1]|uniref:hypothetical protein n=1 Tax=Polyangium sp. 6x1 TaxID=3042689 RepID=UPI002482EA51|nr:hypothetical protein [Polyangium sp. 6x1]MDI1442402.1 hypothetical protein [Polyangium sp. 6x1]